VPATPLFEPTRAPGAFAYAPCTLALGGYEQRGAICTFYCGNPGEGEITDWIVLTMHDGSPETVVLKPSPPAPEGCAEPWDSRHVCDPSVVRGSFSMGGEQYSLALFYTGTQDKAGNGHGNSVGVAFANALQGPWVKRPEPLIALSEAEAGAGAWGVGQPSATLISGGRVMLAYTRGHCGALPSRMCATALDLSDALAPQTVKPQWELPRGGLEHDLCNGDLAFSPTDKRFYMVHSGRPTKAPTPWLPDTLHVRSCSEHDFWKGAGSWALLGTVSPATTGWAKNHDAGLVKTLQGQLPVPPQYGVRVHASVSHSTAWPAALFTYRVVEAEVGAPALTSSGAPFPHWVLRDVVKIPPGSRMDAVGALARSGGRPPMQLFVGDLGAAHDAALLRARSVTTVINCTAGSCGESARDHTPHAGLTYGLVFSSDHFAWRPELRAQDSDPTPQWPSALLVLGAALHDGGNALVHCAHGVNRSVTTAALFLVLAGAHADFDAAVAAIQGARHQAQPLPQYRAWARAFLDSEAGGRTRRSIEALKAAPYEP